MKRLAVIAVLIALVGGLIWFKESSRQEQQAMQRPPVAVVVTEVKQDRFYDQVQALGTARAFESLAITANVTDTVVATFFKDGQQVKRGQTLVQLEDAEEQAELALAKVRLHEQQREFKRIEDLVRQRTVARSELDRLQSQIDAARAMVDQELAKIADRHISAPFSGQLGFRMVSKGALVSPGTVITTLDDISTIKLDFAVPERFLATLSRGSEIIALSDAFPGERFVGSVASIDPRINPSTRSVTVRAHLPNKKSRLRPGMLLKITLIKDSRDTLVIPEEALLTIRDQQYVYLVDEEARVVRIPVRVGQRRPGEVEILEGLSPGQQVISRGKLKVREGQQVTLQDEAWRGDNT
jgi:membrane fusion protein (multidrug efflux system)